ncbi:hypothetical protein FB451DRAFT_1342589 [Mycena latifolia]|nr:hypothetical protein FB451DRAFT_1342589 [Mycena latifolia]
MPAFEKNDTRTSAVSEETVHDAISSASPFSTQFLDKSPEIVAARAIYLKVVVGGIVSLAIVIFAVFSIYWGSVWRTPHHTLPGWIVDFDGGAVGQAVSDVLLQVNPTTNGVSWQVVSASQFLDGIAQLESAIVQEETWYAVTINRGASANLTAAVSAADSSYNSSLAITFFGPEARNENIYRVHSRIVSAQLEAITHQFALQFIKNISSSANIGTILSTAPELVARPIYYTATNLRPFDVTVTSAVTFVGLIYLLILSLFYTLLSRAFQLPFDRHFGSAGFIIFWMLNWISMLACGLVLEAMITVLTARFIPFFLIIWIISNVSVSVFPLQVLPHVYRYGYVFPFYNISRAVRAVIFGTRNDVGLNFGILLAWWFVRRRLVVAARAQI